MQVVLGDPPGALRARLQNPKESRLKIDKGSRFLPRWIAGVANVLGSANAI